MPDGGRFLDYVVALETEDFSRWQGTQKILKLVNLGLNDDDACRLAKALKGNRTVLTLYLTNNRIGDRGGEALLKALPRTNVRMLNVKGNPMSASVAEEMNEVVREACRRTREGKSPTGARRRSRSRSDSRDKRRRSDSRGRSCSRDDSRDRKKGDSRERRRRRDDEEEDSRDRKKGDSRERRRRKDDEEEEDSRDRRREDRDRRRRNDGREDSAQRSRRRRARSDS
eukprot:TRINITY_DN6262_c0_g1_i1.p2 TRINITY_DN6262_c0_g1~~TRINITY_DN6262_c0_g1_i1.p2  ORF type:complete len:241 (+),score=68.26 TRINITY_DN6262_c0_g1_i1:45-725(+)